MTSDQKMEFHANGCLSKCLIAIATLQGKEVTVEEYVERFSHLFEENKFGWISYGSITEILKSLGIGRTFRIFRDRCFIRGAIRENPRPPIIICTENHLETCDPNNLHCSLMMGVAENKLVLGFFEGEDKIPLRCLSRSEDEIDQLSGFYLVIIQ